MSGTNQGIIKRVALFYREKVDAVDVGFAVAALLVIGIGMLKVAAGVIVCGLLVMAFSYVMATPDEKKQERQRPSEVPTEVLLKNEEVGQ